MKFAVSGWMLCIGPKYSNRIPKLKLNRRVACHVSLANKLNALTLTYRSGLPTAIEEPQDPVFAIVVTNLSKHPETSPARKSAKAAALGSSPEDVKDAQSGVGFAAP